MKIVEKVNNSELYLSVEANYAIAAEGRGKQDAVLFEMGSVIEGRRVIDSTITVSVAKAKFFYHALVEVCKEIESNN